MQKICQNMQKICQNMQEICNKICRKICKKYDKYAKKYDKICNVDLLRKICKKICKICRPCQEYAKYALPTLLMAVIMALKCQWHDSESDLVTLLENGSVQVQISSLSPGPTSGPRGRASNSRTPQSLALGQCQWQAQPGRVGP